MRSLGSRIEPIAMGATHPTAEPHRVQRQRRTAPLGIRAPGGARRSGNARSGSAPRGLNAQGLAMRAYVVRRPVGEADSEIK